MENQFSNLPEPTHLRMWCIEQVLKTTDGRNLTDLFSRADAIHAYIKAGQPKQKQHPDLENLYYLREVDLMPLQIKDLPFLISHEDAKSLKNLGLVFKTEEEALKARALMLNTISI